MCHRTKLSAGLLNAQSLLNKAAEAAADLELRLPPLNAPLVLQRTVVELAMPQVGPLITSICTMLQVVPASARYSMRRSHVQNASGVLHQRGASSVLSLFSRTVGRCITVSWIPEAS